MTLFRRGNVYWAYVYIDGVRHAKSTGTNNRRQAELIEQRFKDELNLKRQGMSQLHPKQPSASSRSASSPMAQTVSSRPPEGALALLRRDAHRPDYEEPRPGLPSASPR